MEEVSMQVVVVVVEESASFPRSLMLEGCFGFVKLDGPMLVRKKWRSKVEVVSFKEGIRSGRNEWLGWARVRM